MIRRVVFLAPWHHHHAPYVLDRVLAARPDLEVLLVTTPKLATGKRSALSGLRATRAMGGVVYLGVMGLMSAGAAVAAAHERIRNRPRATWKYLSMRQVLDEHLKLSHLKAQGINAPGTLERIRAFAPEALVTLFFNQILSPELREMAPHGTWNLHPSLLPAYRGVSPVFWTLAEGEAFSGATLHRMTGELDQGPLLGQARIRVEDVDSYFSLYRKCAAEGAGLVVERLGNPDAPVLEPDASVTPSKHGHPTAVAVRRFHRRGRRFFRLW